MARGAVGGHTDGVVAHGVGPENEWEPDPRLVRPKVLSEDILPALEDIKAGRPLWEGVKGKRRGGVDER
jgi:hypothetical protein